MIRHVKLAGYSLRSGPLENKMNFEQRVIELMNDAFFVLVATAFIVGLAMILFKYLKRRWEE